MQNLPINIYLGGSFDPVHKSHIAILKHVYQQLHTSTFDPSTLDQVAAHFLPTSRSPLKQTCTDPKHRFAILTLAAAELNNSLRSPAMGSYAAKPVFGICEQEIWQLAPTYTIDTLTELRCKQPTSSLIFILGADNIANLAKWRDGEQLIKLAHLWILPRDKWQTKLDLYHLLPKSLQNAVTNVVDDLKSLTHGRIYIDSKSLDPLSSSNVRLSLLNNQLNEAKSALPSSVYSYIIKHNLYQKP